MPRLFCRPRKLCAGPAVPAMVGDRLLDSRPVLLAVVVALLEHRAALIGGLKGSCADDGKMLGCPAQLEPLRADVLGANAIIWFAWCSSSCVDEYFLMQRVWISTASQTCTKPLNNEPTAS